MAHATQARPARVARPLPLSPMPARERTCAHPPPSGSHAPDHASSLSECCPRHPTSTVAVGPAQTTDHPLPLLLTDPGWRVDLVLHVKELVPLRRPAQWRAILVAWCHTSLYTHLVASSTWGVGTQAF